MAPGYGINSIGSYASDPYFMYALNSYNPNFMGTQQTPAVSQPQNYTIEQPAVTTTAPSFKGSDDEKESSNAGLIVGGTVVAGAATLIYAAKKGNGKGIKEGFKNIWRGLTGKGAETAAEKAAQEAAEKVSAKIRAVMGKDGKLIYTIPGKTTTIQGEQAIRNFASRNGIDLQDLLKFNKDSKLTGYKFEFKDGHINNIVTVKDGKIVEIHNGTESITDKILNAQSSPDKVFLEKLKQRVSDIENRETKRLQGLKDVEYTNQIGDDILVVKSKKNAAGDWEGIASQLTTLKKYNADSEAVKALFYRNPELKQLFTSKAIKDGKLPNGMKIESFVYDFNGTKCHYKNNELVGITIKDSKGKERFYDKDSDKCCAFLGANEEILQKQLKIIFKDNKVPTDIQAVLVAA